MSKIASKESLTNLFLTIFLVLNAVGIFYNGTIFILKMGNFERAFMRVVYSAVAVLCYIIFSNISVKWLLRKAPIFFAICLLLMGLVFVPGLGASRMGATRWLYLPPFSWLGIAFQPAEIAKLGLIVFFSCILGRFFETHSRDESSWFCELFYNKLHWSRDAVVVFFSLILIFLTVFQKDLTMILFYVLLLLFFLWMAEMKTYKIILLSLLIGVPMVFFMRNDQNRWERIISFRDVEAHRHGAGYQLYHSLISIGSGGMHGKGINEGDHLFWLSEVENDFIIANIAEEIGFIGTGIIILFYLLFFLAGMYVVFHLDKFSYQLLAFGLVLAFTLQALIHFCVVLGLGPTTGIPLPIISYGGTSLVVFGCIFGMMHRLTGELP